MMSVRLPSIHKLCLSIFKFFIAYPWPTPPWIRMPRDVTDIVFNKRVSFSRVNPTSCCWVSITPFWMQKSKQTEKQMKNICSAVSKA